MSRPNLPRWASPELIFRLIIVLCLLIFFTLTLRFALVKGPTADEGAHLLRAQALRQTTELGLQGQHTPLSHWLIGIFFSTDPDLPNVEDLPSWPLLAIPELVEEFLWRSNVDVGRILFLGRLPIIFMGLFTGAMIAHWAWRLSGGLGAAIALVLFAFSPNLIASSALATTDLTATTTILAAILALWHFWRHPSVLWWLVGGIGIGLAISAKLTGLIVLPITLILSYTSKKSRPWWQPGLFWIAMLIPASLILWAVYHFEIGQIGAFPIPASTFISNFLEVQHHINRGHYAYLLGERSNIGWWYYFVVAFLVKTPAITLLLLLLSVVLIAKRRRWLSTIYLWLPPSFLFLAASYSRLNIGYRHILPILPFVWLLIAETGSWWRRQRYLKIALGLGLAIYVFGTLRYAPDYLAYFNEFVGGPNNGAKYLGDSNIDWGQDLPLLANYYHHSGNDHLYISYFGPSDPKYYGIDETLLVDDEGQSPAFAAANPPPGRYAISVNHVLTGTDAEPDLFDWFRNKTPVKQFGHSIYLFQVDSDLDGNWIAQCLDPWAMLEEEKAATMVGLETPRQLLFDCRESWVIPSGSQPGWYILPADLAIESISPFIAENLVLQYTNDESQSAVPYKIYHWNGNTKVIDSILDSAGPIETVDARSLDGNAQIPGLAVLLGGMINQNTWGSIWRLDSRSDEPLSIMLHLYGEDNTPIVADGLGFQATQWQLGDILIQFHNFAGINGRSLETGIYNFTTLEPYPFEIGKSYPTLRITSPK